MKKKVFCSEPGLLGEVARSLLGQYPQQRVFAFYGAMGVGKTTFIKALCNELGVRDVVNSPTFAIVNEYATHEEASVFHFDFYRIKKMEEVLDIGCEEYFYSGSYCLLEWPELIAPYLPEDIVSVVISEDEKSGLRCFEF